MGIADIVGKATKAFSQMGADDPKAKPKPPEEPTRYQGHEFAASSYSLARRLTEPVDSTAPKDSTPNQGIVA